VAMTCVTAVDGRATTVSWNERTQRITFNYSWTCDKLTVLEGNNSRRVEVRYPFLDCSMFRKRLTRGHTGC
jgi:hypothetical protein